MSEEREPVNITINVSDTVPLSLHRELQSRYNSTWNNLKEMEQTAAELRIEVAALTVAREIDESRIKGLQGKVRELESERRKLLIKLQTHLNYK